VTVLAQAAFPRDITMAEWLLARTSWTGPTGILPSLLDTLTLSASVMVTAVLLAVRGPQPELWDVIDKGRVVCDSDGHTHWSRDWVKQHRYVKIDGSPRALMAVIGELMAAPPARAAANP
jgi:hypothetical protein